MSEQTSVKIGNVQVDQDESWTSRLPASARRVPWLAVHVLTLVVGYLVEWWLLRDTWFRSDDFEFLGNRVVADPSWSIWAGHNEHWSTGPVLVWQLLYDWFGVRSASPYFVASLLAHVITAHFVWRLMCRCGVRPAVATGLAASFVVLGAGWDNITWAFQLGFMGSSALGLGAVLLCLRGGRRAYVGALCTTLVSLTFSGISITFVIGAALALALRRQWVRAIGLAVICGTAYVVWYLRVGHLSKGPEHPTGHLQRAAKAADWAWTLLGDAAGLYVSFAAAGATLALGLGIFLVLLTRQEGSVLTLPTTHPARERFVPLVVATGTALIQVAAFTVSRVDISAPDSPRYLYFVIALLLPLFGLALSRAVVRLGRPVIAAVLAYLVITQGLVLVAQERHLEDPQLRADVLGMAHLIAAGEPVNEVSLFQFLTTTSITAWVDEGKMGDLADVPADGVRDARALAQVAIADQRPGGVSAGAVTTPGTEAALATGACASVTAQPGQVAAIVRLFSGQTVSVRLDDPGALVYRVVDGGGASRSIGVGVPVHGTRWVTTTTALTIEVVSDNGQQLTFCVP